MHTSKLISTYFIDIDTHNESNNEIRLKIEIIYGEDSKFRFVVYRADMYRMKPMSIADSDYYSDDEIYVTDDSFACNLRFDDERLALDCACDAIRKRFCIS